MTTFKRSCSTAYIIPKAPFIYINDPTADGVVVKKLRELLPKSVYIDLAQCPLPQYSILLKLRAWDTRDTVFVFADNKSDTNEYSKKVTAKVVHDASIKRGCNFVSINVYQNENTKPTTWNENHFDLLVTDEQARDTTELVKKTEEIWHWLFRVLTVKETLHLFSDDTMKKIDYDTAFKEYEYCAIGDCRKTKRNAKVQFVALVVTKPAIVSKNQIYWQVADKTGVASFYFQHRGPSSQYTWDWCLSLQPGQLKCLPRMPSVQIKENLLTTIAKAPIRVPGTIIHVTGATIKLVGSGVVRIGQSMRMGSRKKWILEEDLPDYLKAHSNIKVVPKKDRTSTDISSEKKKCAGNDFENAVTEDNDEKGSKTWTDMDSSRSTLGEDDMKEEKNFI